MANYGGPDSNIFNQQMKTIRDKYSSLGDSGSKALGAIGAGVAAYRQKHKYDEFKGVGLPADLASALGPAGSKIDMKTLLDDPNVSRIMLSLVQSSSIAKEQVNSDQMKMAFIEATKKLGGGGGNAGAYELFKEIAKKFEQYRLSRLQAKAASEAAVAKPKSVAPEATKVDSKEVVEPFDITEMFKLPVDDPDLTPDINTLPKQSSFGVPEPLDIAEMFKFPTVDPDVSSDADTFQKKSSFGVDPIAGDKLISRVLD
jgi:hypothetical protein